MQARLLRYAIKIGDCMDGFNFDSLKINIPEVNSAIKANLFAEQQQKNQQILDQISKHNAKRDATIMAGAEANVAQKELLEQQLSALGEQNKLLADNYSKLKEMYDAQVQSNSEAKEDLRRSRNFNAWMMVIAIIAMLAAIAGPIATILVSQ